MVSQLEEGRRLTVIARRLHGHISKVHEWSSVNFSGNCAAAYK